MNLDFYSNVIVTKNGKYFLAQVLSSLSSSFQTSLLEHSMKTVSICSCPKAKETCRCGLNTERKERFSIFVCYRYRYWLSWSMEKCWGVFHFEILFKKKVLFARLGKLVKEKANSSLINQYNLLVCLSYFRNREDLQSKSVVLDGKTF